MNYHVNYEIEGKVKTVTYDAHDIGQAYKKCLKDFPGAKLVKGYAYRKWNWMIQGRLNPNVAERQLYQKRHLCNSGEGRAE